MKSETIAVRIEEYQGRTDWPGFKFPIEQEAVTETFENVGELRAAGAFPSDADVLEMVNTKRKNAARAAKYQEITKGLKAAYEDSSDYKRKNLVKAMLAAGFSQDEAEAMAAQKLG